MRAVVLVGGFGTRLRPLTLHTPKQMLAVVDRPMIEWVIAHIAEHGVDEAVLSLGYRPDDFSAAYPDGVCAGVRLHYAVEREPLDTAGAIRFAATSAGIEERFLVVNGDILTDLDVSAVVRFHEEARAEATITLHEVDDPSRYGVVPTDAHGRVTAFVEKPPAGEAPTNRINAGTYVLEPSVLDRIAADRRVSIERETFPAMVLDGTLFATDDRGVYWIDAGTPETYLQAQLDLVAGRRPAGVGKVCAVDATAVVDAAASVTGSVLGPGVRVDKDADVRDSVVQEGAVVRAGARVHRSIVAAGAVIGDGASVDGVTVVGRGERVAPNTTLHGARIPEVAA